MSKSRSIITTNNPAHLNKRGGRWGRSGTIDGNGPDIDHQRRALLKVFAAAAATATFGSCSWAVNPEAVAPISAAGGAQQQHGSMAFFPNSPLSADELLELRKERLDKIRAAMDVYEIDALLLFNPLNQRYAIDATNQTVRNMRYERRCVIIPISSTRPVTVLDWTTPSAPYLYTNAYGMGALGTMDSYDYIACGGEEQMASQAKSFAQQIMSALPADTRSIAADRMHHIGVAAVEKFAPYGQVRDGQPATQHARAIKQPKELILMKHVVDVCQTGMRLMNDATDRLTAEGMRENELWGILQQHNIASGGEWIETRLLCAGARTYPWFQECSGNKFYPGDMVSFDTDLVGPFGYGADISRAWLAGDKDVKPLPKQKELYQYAVNQVTDNLTRVRAGVSYRELAATSWNTNIVPIDTKDDFFANRYSCPYHGVGLCDEFPSIPWVGDDWDGYGYEGELKENMVISVESYIGAKDENDDAGQGCKVEVMVLVKDADKSPDGKGYEVLSDYPWDERLYPDAPPLV